jgi:DNA-binding beta-propeller fold protein YncE
VVVCSECSAGRHDSHVFSKLSEVYPAHRSEIEAELEPLIAKLDSVSKLLSHIECQISGVSAREEIVESGIVNMFSMVEDALQERKSELCETLHGATRTRQELLRVRRMEVVAVQAQLSSCLGFIRECLKLSGEEGVVTMKNTLLKHVASLLDDSHKNVLPDFEEEFLPRLKACPQHLMEKCLEFGRVIAQPDSAPVNHVSPNLELYKLLVQRLGTPLLTLEHLKGPCGVAVNRVGEIMVAEGCGDQVTVFSQSGKKLRSFGSCGTGDGEFTCPCELAVDADGNVLVVDGSNRRIQKFTSEGKFLACVGSSGYGVLQFSEPDGLAVNPVNGCIYVVDNNVHRIQILNPDLTFHNMFGKEGCGQGYLHYPWGITCSCAGEVYVTDSGNCCVQVFSPDGHFLREFGKKGGGDGELRWPTGISVSRDGGVVYVSDYGNYRVCVFSSGGQFLKSIGKKGKRNGEFGNLRGVNVDRNGLVYVCDTDNNRVVLY